MRKCQIILFMLLYFSSFTLVLNAVNPEDQTKLPEFKNGVHFNHWFESSSGASQINFNTYSKKDFINLKKLGGNILRLPINFQAMTSGAPDYLIDDLLLNNLDKAIAWANETNIYIIIDNHTFYPDGSVYYTIEPFLTKLWDQLSLRYKDASDLIMYQICNEPHDVSDNVWGRIQQNIINVIRKNDSTHTIIVSPSGWSSYNRLKHLPVYEDDNLIYDFHFYQPMVFTHQQARFINPPTTSLMDVPFPYDPARMPQFPDDLKGSWFENTFKEYDKIGTVDYLKQQIDIAIEFSNSRNVRIFCGELGVHIPGAPPADRILWYKTVCSYLKENDIPFAIWDYKFEFGLFNYPNNNFPDDLNLTLLEAIGFIKQR